jgi:phospholipid/cholesterol/gamma-HCH transport system substrate-binding protein
MNRLRRAAIAAAAATALTMTSSACRWDGVNSLPMPSGIFSGGTYTITVEMENVANLVNNSEVKVDNVTVGMVRRIDLKNWLADVSVELKDDIGLPANTTAKLAQKSLLGSEYIELTPPAQNAVGNLTNGDTIPLAQTGRYPETEEVLSALSLVLNGSSLDQIRNISVELNQAISGQSDVVKSLVERTHTFVASLDNQRDDILRAIDGVNKLSIDLAGQTDTIDHAVTHIQPAIDVLNQQKTLLTDMLGSVGDFGQKASALVNSSGQTLVGNLVALKPALEQLAAAGDDLPQSLNVAATVLFPVTTAEKAFKGDYFNLFGIVDLRKKSLRNKLLGQLPLPQFQVRKFPDPAADPVLAPLGPPPGPPDPAAEPPDTPLPAEAPPSTPSPDNRDGAR